jgi:inosine/xanthosine triphosphate pyrophosphatase family protein
LKPVILDSSNAPHIPSKCAIKEIQISILAEGRQVENAVKDKHKQIYDPFHLHQHEIAQRITDVNERKSICKSRRKRALKTLDKYLYDQSLNKFQIAQIIRDYDWLCYYEMKLQAGILTEYFGHNKNQAIEQNISVLVKELEAYRKELLKQQEGG